MSDQDSGGPRITRATTVFVRAILGVLALGLIGGGAGWFTWHRTMDRQRSAALANAETRAQRFAPQLLRALSSGPRSVDSLRPLGAEAGIDQVTAAVDGGSVVVTWEASERYDAGWGTEASAAYCMRDVISRDRSALTAQASTIPCTAMLPFTVSTELG